MADRVNGSIGNAEGSAKDPVRSGGLESLPAMFSTRLAAIALRQGITLEEALAQAIRLDEMVLDTQSRKGKVLLVENGRTFRVDFR
jgi:hypothetical protein